MRENRGDKPRITEPEWIRGYCIETLPLSDCVIRHRYRYQEEYGDIYICSPFPGIYLWANDVYMQEMPAERLEDYHFIKLNYCSEGRSEVLLEDDRYVYLEKGMLSVDSNSPKEGFLFPGGRYAGLEMILDLKAWEDQPIEALLEYGVSPARLEARLRPVRGSYLVAASGAWRELAEAVMEKLICAEGSIEDFRFYTLHLLWLLEKGSTIYVDRQFYLTRGQRLIVTKVEEALSRDLKRRYTIEELADTYGVSPSSLKKYFGKVYGMSITEYIRKKRMEHACRLLSGTRLGIAEVAAEAGYGNQGKFGSVFKKYTGKSPLEYRRLHSENKDKATEQSTEQNTE